ncbi:NEDD8 ultimate buster 1 [Tribolium castaneum]|uniref:NEDD8 ultimate buster 1-like Protein n=1 Tax=Tribolium castaneum TaxID=7070 RepID=D2A289_TRICA|nr:PREDICTED: NEDD8 ultimate buster 1 [Tribolium castaneum]EFA02056.1 NEDD8 ultimate buster 1-like Protein [Tribolium castaneum]|eukprot:XP_008191673.1 PREDICTED: NEDD8 ultimate buster 1 [Tribolium castaneum]
MNPCSSHLQKEDILLQIRDNLRKNNVKLWLDPYFSETSGPSVNTLKNLAQNYSQDINASVDNCYEALLELQKNSLENLKQNNHYKESGEATLKIKILHPNSPPRMLTKELLLSLRGSDVKEIIAKEINMSRDKLKLIHAGKVLSDSENLSSQGVKNGQQIMAITFSEMSPELKETENQIRELEGVKTDSRLLALDNEYLQLEDQFGNIVKIPPEEKRALVVAMALHEKGRSALKREDYSRALIFFLEADEEFKRCTSQILNSVDNYALLDLDIAWCYLCLQSVANLPEAFERLKRCEERFHASYGPNLERLKAVKGVTGNEATLFMRLHLLQAIVLYHKNKRNEALKLLKKAQEELSALKVEDDSVTMLVELGYSMAEARLGLRATGGDVNKAANYIDENRNQRSQARQKALAEEILQRKRMKLGKCIDGKQYVDPNFVKILVNMGFNKEAARIALKHTNNVISDSIQYIQEHPQPGPSQSKSIEFLALINDLVPELEAAGFDPTMSKLALHKHGGDIMKAAEDLLANNGIIDGDWSILKADSSSQVVDVAKKEKKDEAFKRIAGDISMVDDDHLDLTLVQEELFLNQYLSLLANDK